MAGTADRTEKARAAAAVKAERQALAGLSRTIKLRVYPSKAQASRINQTIGAIRHVWNTLWLPRVSEAETLRLAHVLAHGFAPELSDDERKTLWRAAYRAHPDPNDTVLRRAYFEVRDHDPDRVWLKEAIGTPMARASIHCADAIKASRGLTKGGAKRKVRAGKVRPKRRRDDASSGLEWQQQGKARLGGIDLRNVVDTSTGTVKVPSLGAMRYRDKGKQLRSYLKGGAEVCELTAKRDGLHYYVCLAVRGLQPNDEHSRSGTAVGIDMGVANPLATSDGELITEHQGLDIKAHLAQFQHLKRRAQRRCSRKFRAAAKRASALTESGAIKKGVPVPTSNRARRAHDRLRNVDRRIANFRADWQRNRALEIVRANELVVVEALTIRNMTRSAAGTVDNPGRNVRQKSGLNREILARGWGSMRARLKSKAEELGGLVIEIDPAYTSQTCPSCGHVSKENRLTQAQFICAECGHQEHADVVGAINALRRGMTAGASPVAGRGGYATSTASKDATAERAAEPSNKSLREPEASSENAEGSRDAKLHTTINELATEAGAPDTHQTDPPPADPTGSRGGHE